MNQTARPGNRVVARLRPLGETIFAQMSQLAAKTGAINLGQGYPDAGGPQRMLQIAQEQIAAGNNQYAPGRGTNELLEAVARQRERRYGIQLDPASEVLITVGATEAITASVLGLVEPGSEVIVFEPYYDAYAAAIALAGATRVAVPLAQAGDTWTLAIAAFEAAITPKTVAVIINSPHNPTGSVFDRATLTRFAQVAIKHDLLVISDEVYEYLTFDTAGFHPLATLPGMRERTVSISSAAKTFNVTGWKTGWATGPSDLIDAVYRAKQFLTYVGVTPVQPAVAYALDHEEEWVKTMVAGLAHERDLLSATLRECGFTVSHSGGTYFLIASALGLNAREFCAQAPLQYGVAAIPVDAFVDHPTEWTSSVRFAFCKTPETMAAARARLSTVKVGD